MIMVFYLATRRYVPLVVLLFTTVHIGITQGQQQKKVSKAPMSGEEMFKSYCASCHGKDARGGGPAASALKVAPPDLTTLLMRNEGKFPVDYVTATLLNGAKAPAHGNAEMPVWGPIFEGINVQGKATLRISNLIHYLESLQRK
jgi:mono/diheme cytochrome c family protein